MARAANMALPAPKRLKRVRPCKSGSRYRQLWRVVDGAVRDTIKMHPEYFTKPASRQMRESIIKRVVGALNGYTEQSVRGRSGNEQRTIIAGGTGG